VPNSCGIILDSIVFPLWRASLKPEFEVSINNANNKKDITCKALERLPKCIDLYLQCSSIYLIKKYASENDHVLSFPRSASHYLLV